jgi:hypothetical protein
MATDSQLRDLTVEEVDRDGERLFEALAACEDGDAFPARVEASLRAALALFARDPALTRLLRPEPLLHRELPAVRARRAWLRRYSELLRDTAKRATASSPPVHLEALLVRGVSWVIVERVRAGRADCLPELLPELSAYVLAYYAVDPQFADRR